MHKFLEGLKDFLYDSIDYIIMIGIVGLVVFIIGWRLDLLFANNTEDIIPKDSIIAGVEDDPYEESPDITIEDEEEKEPDSEEIIDHIVDEELEEVPEQEEPEKPAENTNDKKIVTIRIPAGSSSSNIASILESNGLVSSKSDFIDKTEEMQLSSKLKAGNFDIQSGSSMENILKTLTK